MQFIPGIRELLLKAVRAIGTDHAVELADNLRPILGAVERRIIYREQYVGDGRIVYGVGGLSHREFPDCIHAQVFKGQEHARLRIGEIDKLPGGVGWRG